MANNHMSAPPHGNPFTAAVFALASWVGGVLTALAALPPGAWQFLGMGFAAAVTGAFQLLIQLRTNKQVAYWKHRCERVERETGWVTHSGSGRHRKVPPAHGDEGGAGEGKP